MSPPAAPKGSSLNLVELLIRNAKKPHGMAVTHRRQGRWEDVTWPALLAQVRQLSAALVAAGVQPGDRVAIFAQTSFPWIVCDLAVSASRAICVPVYSSNTSDETRYVLAHSEASLVFVDHDVADGRQAGRLTRLREALPGCPSVTQVVLLEGAAPGDERFQSLADFLALAETAEGAAPVAFAEAFDRRVADVRLEDVSHLLYTSGTTGDPKGVMLTHGNWAFEASGMHQITLMARDDLVMLVLPLAHSFAQVTKAAWLAMGFHMAFGESPERLLANLVEVRPTVLPSVPRIFEKVYAGVMANGMASPGLKGRLFGWAMGHFDAYVQARTAGRPYRSAAWSLAQRLVFAKIRASLEEKLGGRMRLFVSGGAPLARRIAYFFDLLGFKVLEGYGMTESSAGTFVNLPTWNKIGTVGKPFPGTEARIAEDGEVLVRNAGVMKGYFRDEAATREVLQPDGWLHTGDIGELDADNFLRITDRKKDLIVTAGGKNVAPQNLENALKTFPLVSQAMVHGDKRKYLSVLITLNEEVARKHLADRGLSAVTYADLSKHPALVAEVQRVVDQVNGEQPPYATLKRFALLDRDFSQESGELTPTLKVKRKLCVQRYRRTLDAMYDEAALD